MAKYYMKFSKEGYMVYTSHLDLVRLFVRTFNRSGMHLEYSHGFNPHPKMAFAQPLSLGYSSMGEYIEFETAEDFPPEEVLSRMSNALPKGIKLLACAYKNDDKKNLSGSCYSAIYKILIDWHEEYGAKMEDLDFDSFLAQESLIVMKKVKKKKELQPYEIREKIRSCTFKIVDNILIMSTELDAGSTSNLSPELLLQAFSKHFNLEIPRENVEVSRIRLKIDGFKEL